MTSERPKSRRHRSTREPLLVGVDLGSSHVKAVIYDVRGNAVSQSSVATITHYPHPHWAYHEPEELWQIVCEALRDAIAGDYNPDRIVSIAVASFGEAGVPIDAQGDPTYHAIAWFDRRTLPQSEWLAEAIGDEALFASSGLSLQPIFTLCKLLWIKHNEPEAWSRTTRWLMAADYIAYRLTGKQATDYSLASRTLAFNIRHLRWDNGILAACGIKPALFAEPVPSGSRLGVVTSDASKETGLPVGVVVGMGGHDHVCGSLAAGTFASGDALDSMGTAEGLFLPVASVIEDAAFAGEGYTQGVHVVPDTYYLMASIYTSGASVEWIRDILGHDDYATLMEEAAQAPAGSLGAMFVPHLRYSTSPHNDPRARGALIGLTTDMHRSTVMRAVLEGLAFEGRATLEPMLRYANLQQMPPITVIGGSTRNDLLLRIKAAVMGVEHRVIDLEEATSLGAAMLGGIAAGLYRNARDASVQVSPHPQIVRPDLQLQRMYAEIYSNVYARLYETLREMNHEIDRLQSGATNC